MRNEPQFPVNNYLSKINPNLQSISTTEIYQQRRKESKKDHSDRVNQINDMLEKTMLEKVTRVFEKNSSLEKQYNYNYASIDNDGFL